MSRFDIGDGSEQAENTRFNVTGLSLGGTARVQFDGGGGSRDFLIEDRDDPSISVVDSRPFTGGRSGRQVQVAPTDRSGLPKQGPTYRGSFVRVEAAEPSNAAGLPLIPRPPPQTFVEDTDRTDDPGGASEETEVLGDDEEITQVTTQVVYGINRAVINEQGFIDNLEFELKEYNSLGGNIRQGMELRSDKNVFIFVERYRVPSIGIEIKDYVPTTDMPRFQVLTNSRVTYSQEETDSLKEVLGSNKTNLGQVLDSIETIFGSLSSEADLNLENSIITNRFESKKKIKLSSVSKNLPVFSTTPEDPTSDLPESASDLPEGSEYTSERATSTI